MSKLVIFDSNFIFSANPQLEFISKLKEKGIECYSSELIKEEMKGQNIRRLKKDYDNIVNTIKKSRYSELYFSITDTTDIDKAIKDSDSRMDAHFKKIFQKNIIPMDSKASMIDELLERSKVKKPPFSDEDNSSDKGFKDTLIWVNFLKFCKKTQFDNYVFITKDNGFIKNSPNLLAEFVDTVGASTFEFKGFSTLEEVNKYFGIDDQCIATGIKDDSPFIKEEKMIIIETSEDLVRKIRIAIYEILYTNVVYDFYDKDQNNFVFANSILDFDIERICDSLLAEKNNFMFFPSVDLQKIFSRLGIECTSNYKVEISKLNTFINTWNDVKTSRPDLKIPFMEYMKSCMNEMVEHNSDSKLEEDLPF